jgi:hypothetical protein
MFGTYEKSAYEVHESPSKYKTAKLILISCISAVLIILIFAALNSYYNLALAKNSLSSMEKIYYKQSATLNEITSNIPVEKDKYYEEKLTALLSKEELSSLANENWKYSLTVNDLNISQESVSIGGKDIYILLTETKNNSKPLPKKISASGSLTSEDKATKFYDYLKLDSPFKYELYVETQGDITNVYYGIIGVNSGSTINIKLEQPLKERLQLNSDTIQIKVN